MFQDRKHAGELLAGLLESYRGQAGTVVLGLARGGVPVAAAVARELALPLDVFVVRKIGAPHQPELAIGAVASGGVIVLDERAVQAMQLSQAELDLRVAQEREELLRRERLYRGERPPLALAGQTVLLVDDGLATGYTMLAAVRAVRQQLPAAIVVAVPVAPPETLNRLRADVDEIVCVDRAERLFAVGQFYEDFSQTSDEQVQRELSGGRPA
jgi:putative phosphoribosyl transferase